MESRITRLFVILICGISSYTAGHNWLDTPISRGNQQQSQTGCRVGGEGGINCPGPCDRTLSATTRAPTTVQRGQTIEVKWNMHNHPGGFVRLAWCPTSESDSHACFDAHVQQYTCKQHGGCSESNPLCATTISAPTFLSDGAWTLQWAYFGGFYQAGDYYACTDYKVSGGSSVTDQSNPTFIGGDTTNPNSNTCLFYNTDALHVCVVEPCTTGTYPGGARNGVPSAMNSIAKSLTTGSNKVYTTGASSPATTGRIAPATTGAVKPATTGAVKPATTGAVKPATTGSASPYTTGKPSPITTGFASPATTGLASPVTTGLAPPATTGARSSPVTTGSPIYTTGSSSKGCTNGHMKCLTSQTFSTCSWGAWQSAQLCASGTSCSESGDYIYCVAGSTPATPPSVPTPLTTSSISSTLSTTTTSDSSTPCVFGNQRCSSSNSYQTCTYGPTGLVWSQSQSCQAGLRCHASSANNKQSIYCY